MNPVITTSTNLAINKLVTRTWETPIGFTDLPIKADQVYLGNTKWLSDTSTAIKFLVPTCAVEGLSIGASESLVAALNTNKISPHKEPYHRVV